MTDDRNPGDSEQPRDGKRAWKTFTEEIDIAASQLLGEINRLVQEGNVRRLEIRSEKGDISLAIPLTAGVVGGGIVALAAPWLVILGTIAGLVARVKVSVVREIDPDKPVDDKGPPLDV